MALLDIANIIGKVANHPEFEKTKKALKLLGKGSPALNRNINKYQADGKQDSDSDKLIELIVGASCLSFGSKFRNG